MSYVAKTTGSVDNNKQKGNGGKIAQDVKALQGKYNLLLGLVISLLVIIVLDITGIVINIVQNYDLNNKLNKVEGEIILVNAKFDKNSVDISRIGSNSDDSYKKIETINNIMKCFSYKKYWQYQDCFSSSK